MWALRQMEIRHMAGASGRAAAVEGGAHAHGSRGAAAARQALPAQQCATQLFVWRQAALPQAGPCTLLCSLPRFLASPLASLQLPPPWVRQQVAPWLPADRPADLASLQPPPPWVRTTGWPPSGSWMSKMSPRRRQVHASEALP